MSEACLKYDSRLVVPIRVLEGLRAAMLRVISLISAWATVGRKAVKVTFSLFNAVLLRCSRVVLNHLKDWRD